MLLAHGDHAWCARAKLAPRDPTTSCQYDDQRKRMHTTTWRQSPGDHLMLLTFRTTDFVVMIGLMLLVEPKIPGSLSYFYILPIPHAHGTPTNGISTNGTPTALIPHANQPSLRPHRLSLIQHIAALSDAYNVHTDSHSLLHVAATINNAY